MSPFVQHSMALLLCALVVVILMPNVGTLLTAIKMAPAKPRTQWAIQVGLILIRPVVLITVLVTAFTLFMISLK